MATRTPVVVFCGTLTTVPGGASYTVPANALLTISAATFNNTTAAGVTVEVDITPPGGSSLAFVGGSTDMNIPASGAAPTTVPGLVGQTIAAGGKIEMFAAAAASVNAWVSGYLQQ